MTNLPPPLNEYGANFLNEYGANFAMRLPRTDFDTARDRTEKALENQRPTAKHHRECSRDHPHHSILRNRGIELAASPGAGKTGPLSVPPAGFFSPAGAANIAGPLGLIRSPNPDASIRLHLEQCASHPEGTVS